MSKIVWYTLTNTSHVDLECYVIETEKPQNTLERIEVSKWHLVSLDLLNPLALKPFEKLSRKTGKLVNSKYFTLTISQSWVRTSTYFITSFYVGIPILVRIAEKVSKNGGLNSENHVQILCQFVINSHVDYTYVIFKSLSKGLIGETRDRIKNVEDNCIYYLSATFGRG